MLEHVKGRFVATAGLAILFLSQSLSVSLEGTSIYRSNLSEMSRTAQSIYRVRTVSMDVIEAHKFVWTALKVQVIDTLKGETPESDFITVHLPGGAIKNGPVVRVYKAPQFDLQREYVIFVDRNFRGDQFNILTSWASYLVSRDEQTGEIYVMESAPDSHSVRSSSYRALSNSVVGTRSYGSFVTEIVQSLD
ncbi:MAG: hypothetical protein COV44_08690 [Deltaproteobacteria bacterium CG11_big_fil_rev_8_21_14_0_20_45_16]|nr:MAG: hypothetical protein COV44_08690 [Deltaproteobacteria bacterium CG11_big_fil_rev_8_21_14_0_20_45_16]